MFTSIFVNTTAVLITVSEKVSKCITIAECFNSTYVASNINVLKSPQVIHKNSNYKTNHAVIFSVVHALTD